MFVAIRDFTVRWLGYADLFSGLKDLGVSSFELFVSRDLKESTYQDMGHTTALSFDFSTEASIQTFGDKLSAAGVKVCAILIENDFGRADLQAEIDWVVNACKVGAALDVEAVRINSIMKPRQTLSEAQYAQTTASAIKAILDQTAGLTTCLALENHGVVGNKRELIRDLLATVGSDRLGLTLDTGNFYWFGYPLDEVYAIIEEFAGYVKHTHLKNVSYAVPDRQKRREPGAGWPDTAATIYAGDIDHKQVCTILRTAGYDGDLTIEDESLGGFPKQRWLEVIRKDIEYVNSLL